MASVGIRVVLAREGDRVASAADRLPDRLAQACRQILTADGAIISLLTSDFRLPLGGSDEVAICAERLQFTLGAGPGPDAFVDDRSVVAGEEEIASRWPQLHAQFVARTPYRSMTSVPFALSTDVVGVLDLYHRSPELPAPVATEKAHGVAQEIGDLLMRAAPSSREHDHGLVVPAWMDSPSVQRRENTWIALETTLELGLAAPDGLALLRAYCYARDLDLDDVSQAICDGRLKVDQLRE